MSTDSNSIDLNNTDLLAVEVKKPSGLAASPVSPIEEDKRVLLQKSLSNVTSVLTENSENRHVAESPERSIFKAATSADINISKVHEHMHHNRQSTLRTDKDDEEDEFNSRHRIGTKYRDTGKKILSLSSKIAVAFANYGLSRISSFVDYFYNFDFKALAVNVISAANDIFYNSGIYKSYVGIKHFYSGICCSLSNEKEKADEHFKKSSAAISGAIEAAGDFTGVTQIYKSFTSLCKGDFKGALILGSIGSVQLYLTFSTLGFGNVLSKSGIESAKEGLRLMAGDSGREIVTALEKRITSEVLEKAGKSSASQLAKSILGEWDNISRELVGNVRRMANDISEKSIESLLKKHRARELITSCTDSLLEKIATTGKKDLATLLKDEFKVELHKSAKMAKCLKKALRKKNCYYYPYHKQLASEATDVISAQINENLMSRGLKDGFDSVWLIHTKSIQKIKKLEDEITEAMHLAGKEGFEAGTNKGIWNVVHEAVEDSFRKFRGNRNDTIARRKKEKDQKKAKEQSDDAIKAIKELKERKEKERLKKSWKKAKPEEIIRDENGQAKVIGEDPFDKKFYEQ